MQTDKILVSANGTGWDQALEEAGKFASYVGLDKKAAMRVRLMTEEALGLIEAIAGDFNAEYRIESDKNCTVRLYLKAKTDMDFAKRKELIAASSDKKNAAALLISIIGQVTSQQPLLLLQHSGVLLTRLGVLIKMVWNLLQHIR